MTVLSIESLENILDLIPEAIFAMDCQGRVVLWNSSIEQLTGLPRDQIVGKDSQVYAVPFYGRPRATLVDLVINKASLSEIQSRYENVSVHGNAVEAFVFSPLLEKYLWLKAAPLLDNQGRQVGAVEMVRDVTEDRRRETSLRESEAKLIHWSQHDPLTRLHNRHRFEQELRRVDSLKSEHVGVLSFDVDGLRLVNQRLGHEAGDQLLRALGKIVRQLCPSTALAARVGGDEFAILWPDSTQEQVEQLAEQLSHEFQVHTLVNPQAPVTLSVGWSCSDGQWVEAARLFEAADDEMCKKKLHSANSARSGIVSTLMKALAARDFITEGHAERLQRMAVTLAAELGLTSQEMLDLSLLAQFHDIGKVGIPDSILFKRGTLTAAEKIEMQRHAEIGYRIAQSSVELSSIAELILKHHEWWNGQGYPFGLKGESIPLPCRILAILDAYDAMTNSRPYRQAISPQAALQELEQGAGTQFDPWLVRSFAELLRTSGVLEVVSS
ncbi:MAG: HD domain-containing phosphohydrolase [Bacillota bacterium]|jgi:diguanylate cyclase (GGDEF)-like protein/PAS domain S-box-containing protein